MNQFKIIAIFLIIFGTIQTAYAQTNELVVSDEEKIILFTAFSVVVISIFLFLARDVILRNYYEVLGVEINATAEQIKKNFRELAKKTHPDKTKDDSEEEMIKINKAYEVLSDNTSKERYDRYLNKD